MGHEVSIIVRSTPLRNFDQDMVKRIVTDMESHGIRFLRNSEPKSFEKLESGRILAKWSSKDENGATLEYAEEFDTVLQAVGRTPDTKNLGLTELGVTLEHGRVKVGDFY